MIIPHNIHNTHQVQQVFGVWYKIIHVFSSDILLPLYGAGVFVSPQVLGQGIQEVGIRVKDLCWSVVIQSPWDRTPIDIFIIGVHRQVITGCTPDSLGSNVSASSWWDWSEFDQCRSATCLMSRLTSVLLDLGYLSSLCNTPGTWTNSLC